MLPSTFDRPRPRARIRQSCVRVGALLAAGLLAAGAVLGAAAPAQADPLESLTVDGITYAYDPAAPEAGATASAYDGAQGAEVTIPQTVAIEPGNTLTVSAIGDYAFAQKSLTSVSLPEGITTIGENAFRSNDLTTLVLPERATTIKTMAFAFNKLASVTLPSSLTEISTAVFAFNDLTAVVIPDTVTSIGRSAFATNRLQGVIIPDSVTSIAPQAFQMNNLTSVALGNNVETIETDAFSWNALDSVVIPPSVRTIGGNAFGQNDSVFHSRPTWEMNPDDLSVADSTLKTVTFLGRAPSIVPTANTTAYPAPDSAEFTHASWGSFGAGHDLLVTYPLAFQSDGQGEGFTAGTWQGYASKNVETKTIDGVTYQYDPTAAFEGAAATGYARLHGSKVTIVPNVTFAAGGSAIPVKTIGDSAFMMMDLTEVNLPDGITTIGDYALAGNSLNTFSVPSSVSTIGIMAFAMSKLTSIDLPSALTEINMGAFAMNSLTTVKIPDTVTRIGESAFTYNELTSITIPDSVTTIEPQAFMNNALTSLTLGSSVESIGVGAFLWNSLESVIIPASVHTIEGMAFGENNTYFLTRPIPSDWNPQDLKDEDSTLRNVTFAGRPPVTFVPTTGPDSDPHGEYALKGSLGSGTGLTVTYPLAFETGDPSTGFTAVTWQGYASAAYVAVSFAMGGHGDQVAPQRITPGQTATTPATAPTASGFTFTGWFTDAALTKTFDFGTAIASDTTVYAGWTKNVTTASVSFAMNGHGTQVVSQTVALGQLATAPAAPSASGYTFTGWYTTSALTTKFNFSTPITGTTSVYAGWTKNAATTTVSFAMNGHGQQIAAQTVVLGKLVTKPTAPSATGYTFTGWFTDAKTTKAFNFGTKITGTSTLYAGWKKNTTVSFAMNGHGTQIKPQTVIIGQPATKPTAPSATGYTFTGWFTDTKTTKAFNFSTRITGTSTLYAGWKKNTTASVSFAMNGHGKQITAQTVVLGKLVTKPSAPSATGYTFRGWFTDAKSTKAFNFSTKITGKTTLYAGWTKKAVTG